MNYYDYNYYNHDYDYDDYDYDDYYYTCSCCYYFCVSFN